MPWLWCVAVEEAPLLSVWDTVIHMAPPRERPDGVLRDRMYALRLADDELQLFQTAAADAGISVSAFIRNAALAEMVRKQRKS